MSYPDLRVKIYGSRGSYSPTVGNATSIGVNTTCFRIDIGSHVLIFDAGSGIINCGQDLVREMFARPPAEQHWTTHLFFTHMHIDHLVGFPYFAMLYMPKSQIHFIAPRIMDYQLEDVLNTFMHPPYFPVSMQDLPFRGNYHDIAENTTVYFYEDRFEIVPAIDSAPGGWLAKITNIRNYMHPKGGSHFYRIESRSGKVVVIASDTEGFVGGDQRLIQFAKDADLLMHDAQYTPEDYGKFQGFGHSTYEMACDIAKKAGVKQLLLIHHDPKHGDEKLQTIEASARKLFPETHLASESMEFDF